MKYWNIRVLLYVGTYFFVFFVFFFNLFIPSSRNNNYAQVFKYRIQYDYFGHYLIDANDPLYVSILLLVETLSRLLSFSTTTYQYLNIPTVPRKQQKMLRLHLNISSKKQESYDSTQEISTYLYHVRNAEFVAIELPL